MQVTIKKVTPKKQGVKNGRAWTISEVELEDGRTVDTFDSFKPGDSAEVEITENGKYNPSMKRTKRQSDYQDFKNADTASKVLSNESDKEQRITMLSCISSACNFYQQRQGSEEMVMEFSKKLFSQAMAKNDQLPF